MSTWAIGVMRATLLLSMIASLLACEKHPPIPAKKPSACTGDAMLVELDESATRVCATYCTDPACDCARAVVVVPNGELSSAPGDHVFFCVKK